MAWRIPIVDLAAEYAEVGAAVEEAVLRVLRSGCYVLGPETAALEAELAALVGVPFAVGVGSGTEALALALRAVGVEPGDEVVTSAFSFFATAEAILQCGARPVFADIEPDTYNLDPRAVAAAVTDRTRAVIPVHLGGLCCDMEAIMAVAERHGLIVIEDAAHAHGATHTGRGAGGDGLLVGRPGDRADPQAAVGRDPRRLRQALGDRARLDLEARPHGQLHAVKTQALDEREQLAQGHVLPGLGEDRVLNAQVRHTHPRAALRGDDSETVPAVQLQTAFPAGFRRYL